MKITCGTDIIEIDRVKKAIEDSQEDFLNRVFNQSEIEYCEGRKKTSRQKGDNSGVSTTSEYTAA